MQNSPFDWLATIEAIKERLGPETVSRWLEPLSVSSVTDSRLVLEAPNLFFRDWVTAHYIDALRLVAGGREVQVVAQLASASTEPIKQPAESAAVPQIASVPRAGARGAPFGHALNSGFSFDRFVVGPSNRFAHAASMAIAASPAKAYNPLFIYGGVGLGKTHLMQATGHAILRRWPSSRVAYVSSEEFANELITAIQTRTTSKFRARYRTVEVLLVDDVHFLAGKEATQEEFFHTFNSLYDAHKQIVLSSDRLPKEIAGLEERLVSRFEWGLVTDIQPPDLETRAAIVRKKAQEAGVDAPNEVTNFIASQVTSNIRELEGALIRVTAYCQLFNKPMTAEIAQEVLKELVREVISRVTLDMIQQRIAGYFQIALADLRGPSRNRSILYPRQLAMFLCRRLTDASLPEIGQAFGGRDHTTVMHAVDKITREITQDINKKHLVNHLNQLVITTSQQTR